MLDCYHGASCPLSYSGFQRILSDVSSGEHLDQLDARLMRNAVAKYVPCQDLQGYLANREHVIRSSPLNA